MLSQQSFAATTSMATSTATTTSTGPVASGSTITVRAIGSGTSPLLFQPDNIKADVGSLIEFQFYPQNHSVVQSSFDSPCTPASGEDIIYSGFFPVLTTATTFPTYTIRINDTDPIWLYCSQGRHCQNGMVMVINAPSDDSQTLAKYSAAAKQASSNISPSNEPFGGVAGTGQSSSSTTDGSMTTGSRTTGSTTGASATGTGGASSAKAVGWWVVLAGALVAGLVLS